MEKILHKYGIKGSSFSSHSEYCSTLKSFKEYAEKKKEREFHNKQVNGTIFAHEGDEGQIL